MKKTLTVNLGGTVFHIDEDAYQLLDKYLSNLRVHFKKEEGSEEIMNDFEMRISELFTERIRLGYEVITIVEVEDVIARMGKPEELFEDEPSGEKHHHSEYSGKQTVQKRFFRNPDDKMIGGVAGGFAAYMGWDPTAIRIALFVLLFFYGVMIPIYIVLWLIVPEAKTAAEKLQMRGESVTVENIGKTVTDGFEKVSENVNNYINSDKPRTFIQKVMDVFVTIVSVLLKIMLVLLAVAFLPPVILALFVLVIVLFALIFGGGFGMLYSILPNFHWNTFDVYPESVLIFASITTILTIAIPLISLVYVILSQIFKFKPLSNGVKWAFVIIWVLALLASIIFFFKFGIPFFGNWTSLPWDASWNSIRMIL